jgi:hypothetical protein
MRPPRLSARAGLCGAALLAVSVLLVGCAECTQMILAKGDLSNVRAPHGAWQQAGDVRLDPADPTRFEIVPGKGVLVNGPTGGTVDALTTAEYADVKVSYDFCVPKSSRAGIYFMGRYGLRLADSHGVESVTECDCGAVPKALKDSLFGEIPPAENACRQPGEWQRMEIVFRAPRFDRDGVKIENARFNRVSLNNRVIHRDVEVAGPTQDAYFEDEQAYGPLMALGGAGPVAIRNLRITPLYLP